MVTITAATPEPKKTEGQPHAGSRLFPNAANSGLPKPVNLAALLCATEGCSNEASMQCPMCLKLGAPSTRFCSQQCFKGSWAQHAQTHTRFQRAQDFVPPTFRYTGTLRPSYVTPRLPSPAVPRPDYALTGNPVSEDQSKFQRIAPVFTPAQVDSIRAAARLGREALDLAAHMCVPGALPDDIDRAVHQYIVARGGYPSTLNYRGFPKSLCISINEVVCHGIPDMRPLQDGDIVNVDVTAFLNGYHGDMNETYTVGTVDQKGKDLIKAAHDSMMAAIATVKPGQPIREFGNVITAHARPLGFSVVRNICGHGIGDLFHCAPNVPHHANNKAVGTCKPGMVLTIEPMINEGAHDVRLWKDDWTIVTADGKRSAQFEHTLVVTEDGCELLSARLPTSRPLWWEEEAAAASATAAASPDAATAEVPKGEATGVSAKEMSAEAEIVPETPVNDQA